MMVVHSLDSCCHLMLMLQHEEELLQYCVLAIDVLYWCWTRLLWKWLWMMIQDDDVGCHCHGKFQGQGVCAFVYDMDHASRSMV